MRRLSIIALAMAAFAATEDYQSCQRKFDQIEAESLSPGSRVVLTMRELNAWVAQEAPAGVRLTKVTVPSAGVAVGTAMVDFAKLQSQGHAPGFLMQKLLGGEHPVSVTAKIRSGDGMCTVDVQKVEISGMLIDGNSLQFLIDHFLLALYPSAAVSQPFELGHRMDHLEILPAAVTVVIGH